MMKRIACILGLIVAALLLISCVDDMPSRYVPVDEGPMLDLPYPTITATATRIAWKPGTYVDSASPYHPASMGVAASSAYVSDISQNWGYISVGWGDLEPTRGNYDFDIIDDALAGVGSNRTLMLKVIVNSPGATYDEFHFVPEWMYGQVYFLPDTTKYSDNPIVPYTLLPASTRVVCSPYNWINYNELTSAQKANFDQYCRYSTRVAGWDAAFLEYWDDLMQALANEYDNELKLSGFGPHSGGDYGEAALMYGCLSATECPSGSGEPDSKDPDNTYVRTMAEIYGVDPDEMVMACRPDDAEGTFSSIYYENSGYTYSSCWGRYYAYSIKRIIDVTKEHWRATPLFFSMGSGIIPQVGYLTDWNVGPSMDVLSYALNCYGDYSVYAKQDGWAPGSGWYLPMWWFANGSTPNGLTTSLGRTVTSMEHGNESYWLTEAQHIQNISDAVSADVMFPCIRSDMYKFSKSIYAAGSAQFKANFDSLAKAGVNAYVPPEPQSCLGGVEYPTQTPTITPGGPTLTHTPTATSSHTPTVTNTPGGPTATHTPTSTSVPGAGSITLYPVQDSWLSVTAPTTNWGTYTTMSIRHAGNSRPILQFDLSSIPAGAVISSAQLKFTVTSWDYGTATKTFGIYQVDESWGEYTVTWNSRNGVDAWSSGGAAYSTDLGDSTISSAGQKTFASTALTTLVQNWFAETADNYGLVFISAESDFQSGIASREHAEKPELIVYYTLPTSTATPTPTATSTLSAVIYAGRELVVNPGFEIDGAGGADQFYGWTEVYGTGGSIYAGEASYHWGTQCVRIDEGSVGGTRLYRDFSVAAGQTYRMTAWTRGDGTNDAHYWVRDMTNVADIIAFQDTDIITTTWTPLINTFTVPAGCTTARLYLYGTYVEGTAARWDDISLIRTDAHYYTASVGEVITYTAYISANASVSSVTMYNAFMITGPTPVGATPTVAWEDAYKRYGWDNLTVNATPQGFASVWRLPPDQAPGGRIYRNVWQAVVGSEAIAETTIDAVAYAPTYTLTPTATATHTPTVTPTPTATHTPVAQFWINEVVSAPTHDWNIDGQHDDLDQWIEMFNGNTVASDISGYQLAITGNVSTYTYTFGSGVVVPAWDYLIVWPGEQIGTSISNTGYITLYSSGSVEVDNVTIPGATPIIAYARMPDAGVWQWWPWPSFGRPNAQATPTATYTSIPTRTPTATATP